MYLDLVGASREVFVLLAWPVDCPFTPPLASVGLPKRAAGGDGGGWVSYNTLACCERLPSCAIIIRMSRGL